MTFKVGDKVRRKREWLGIDGWSHGGKVFTVLALDQENDILIDDGNFDHWFAHQFELVQRVADKFVPETDKFEPVYEPITLNTRVNAWSEKDIGPFEVQVGHRTTESAWDTMQTLWFNDAVGQKLNALEIEYKESPDMTEETLFNKIMEVMHAIPHVTQVVIEWKVRSNGISWHR